jgi:Bacterial Ig-like domain (group 3)
MSRNTVPSAEVMAPSRRIPPSTLHSSATARAWRLIILSVCCVLALPRGGSAQIIGQVSIGGNPGGSAYVNATAKRLYVSDGYATSPTTVVDVSTPTSPTIITTVPGSGAIADAITGTFYTSSGFGGQILVFNASTNAQIASPFVGFCGGASDFNPVNNLIYMIAQCGAGNDPLFVVDGSTNNVIAGPLGSGGIVGQVRVNPATGNAYVCSSGHTRVFGPPPSFSFLTDISGLCIAAINPVTNLLYLPVVGSSGVKVLDGNTNALVGTIGSFINILGINTSRNLLYAPDPSNTAIDVLDGATNLIIRKIQLTTLGTQQTAAGPWQVSVDPSRNLVYTGATLPDGTHMVFVIQDPPTAAATATTLASSPNPSLVEQSATFTATVNPVSPATGTPTGTVTFTDASTSTTLGTATLISGQAPITISTLAVGTHTITAQYSGDSSFLPSSGSISQQVVYSTCLLYDPTRSVHSGAVYPIKLYLCDANGADVSSSGIALHATSVSQVSGFSGSPESPGNANPDLDFRYDSTLGPSGGYIFNLSTQGLASGTYQLNFSVTGDPLSHTVSFGVN